MHTPIGALAVTGLAALGLVPGCSHTGSTATEVAHVVAVDSEGQPSNGYHEQPSHSTVTAVSDCAASPGAVGADIYQCWPAAAGADACWPAAPGSLLCVDDPWNKQLHRVTVDKPLLHAQPTATPQPLALLLDDGTRCRLRNGGAWGGRDDGYLGGYGCQSSALTVLVKDDRDVIDRTTATWTVKVGELGAGDSHFPPPETRSVETAWFADNAG
jgi:hypothetical protein